MDSRLSSLSCMAIITILVLAPLTLSQPTRGNIIAIEVFALPLIGFLLGYFLLLKYIGQRMKFSFGVMILSLLAWSISEYIVGSTVDGTLYPTQSSSNVFYVIGFLALFASLALRYRSFKSKLNRMFCALMVFLVSLAFLFSLLFFYSQNNEQFLTLEMNYLFAIIAMDLVIVLIAATYYIHDRSGYERLLWFWLIIIGILSFIGDLTFGSYYFRGIYSRGSLPDVFYCLGYGGFIAAFHSLVSAEKATFKDVEERYFTLFNHTGAPTIMIDGDSTILLTNLQFNTLMGYDKEEIIGKKKLSKMIDIKDRKTTAMMLNRMRNVKTLKPFTKDAQIRTRNGGTLFTSLTFSFIPNSDFIVVTIFDLTDRKKLEIELKKINEDLQNFTFTVSHDLKEPLRNVSSLATYLKRDYSKKLDKDGIEFLNMLVTSVSTMSQLVDDLLTLSRVGRKNVDFSFVDFNELVNDVVKDIEKFIKEKNAVVRCSNLPKALVQKTWMKQVFQNLIVNGIKFNDSTMPTVEISCTNHNFFYEFAIKDNGIGIPKEYRDRIFKLFEQLHPREEYGGTGAGLAIVKKIIKEHKGDIWLESKEGKGTTFYFTIEKFFIGED